MKKIILWGDGLLVGSTGYAELLAHHIFLHHPQANVSTSIVHGTTPATWRDVLRDAPLHVIGKAPDLVILGLGSADLSREKSPDAIAQHAQAALTMMLQKTQSKIVLLSVVSSFFAEDAQREACQILNRRLRELAVDRVAWVDLETQVDRFLELHRQGLGEKHSLHLDPARLTPFGRLFLAHHAFQQISWPDLNPEA